MRKMRIMRTMSIMVYFLSLRTNLNQLPCQQDHTARAVNDRVAHTPGAGTATPTRRASEGSGRDLPRWRVGLVSSVGFPIVNRPSFDDVRCSLSMSPGNRPSCRLHQPTLRQGQYTTPTQPMATT